MNNKYKILLIEDEVNISGFVANLLEANGYQVIKSGSCASARTLYFSHVPDLLILDLGLPDGDGANLLRDLRQRDTVPVIVLSARNAESE